MSKESAKHEEEPSFFADSFPSIGTTRDLKTRFLLHNLLT